MITFKKIIVSLMAILCTVSVVAQDKLPVVYFTKEITPESLLKLYEKLDIHLTGKTGVKVHFGEDGNRNFINPELYRLLIEKVNGYFVETNVLYVGKRRFTESHIQLAKEHGFTYAPIDILDSDGEKDIDVRMFNLKHYKRVKVGRHFLNYDNYIIISHFKGHGSAGFGGAIKNLAMGFASPGGKMAQHATDVPIINDIANCIGCAACVQNCPANAISIINGKATIDKEKCLGCAKCIAECPLKLISPDRKKLAENVFLERLVEYAYVFQKEKPMVYINILANISASCDCSARAPLPFTQDIGILVSTDIVAIEKASHDLVSMGHHCEDAFLKENGVSGIGQVNYAEKLGMGNQKYKLVEIK
ncbi:MAG: DUF362 domain-containing protein [Bacteroidales bacterium]|jgi:uncharacterized Fe-S center protein|nr:DUF362 domain-containing protein [Bacteroidales bacterium]